MSATPIEWTDKVWNPVSGCDRVSPGCDHCYALTMAKRLKGMGQAHYQADGDPRTSGPGFALTVHPDSLEVPLHWRKPARVFVNSMSDLFHPEVLKAMHEGQPFLAHVLATMVRAERHSFQVLTKRPQLMARVIRHPMFKLDVNALLLKNGHPVMPGGMSEPETPWPSHMWFGTSIELDRYTFRANHLRDTPAAVRFLSLEPLLGPLPSLDLTGIDWVIVGGESGRGARPMHPEWARDIRNRCLAAGIPFFFKQWGTWGEGGNGVRFGRWVHPVEGLPHGAPMDGGVLMTQMGKHYSGRELDGRTWDEYPGAAP